MDGRASAATARWRSRWRWDRTVPAAAPAPSRSGTGRPGRHRPGLPNCGGTGGARSRAGWPDPSAEPDARIEIRVEDVHDQVRQDVADGEEEHHALDDEEIPAEDGVDHQPADTGQGKERLGDDGVAEEAADLESDHGDDGDERVLEGVLGNDHSLAEALGLRRAHVVLAQHFEHSRADRKSVV